LPNRWEKFDDIALIPNSSFRKEHWKPIISDEFWIKICQSLNVERLARSGEIIGEKRESTVEMLVGEDDWVIRKESGIKYGYHIKQCMFSSGNINERRRMGEVVSENEIVVDLFCGIGYYTIPILVKNNVKHVYSCEWNINSINALKYNLENNNVEKKCTIIEGDNRETTDNLENIADRVLLGLLPTAEESYHVALKCIKEEGGILHIHGLSPSNNHEKFLLETSEKLQKIDYNYIITNYKINKIKSYAPHWDHLVLDIQIEKRN
jgi:tRNA wybutosine-synthesizing protein 3